MYYIHLSVIQRARHALNCILTAYRLHEWVCGDWLQTDYEAWGKAQAHLQSRRHEESMVAAEPAPLLIGWRKNGQDYVFVPIPDSPQSRF